MRPRLSEILAEKRKEVERLKKIRLSIDGSHALPSIRDFKGAISIPNSLGLIAEIKFASPSAGIIREEVDPLRIGQIYEEAGATAISLLTDKRFFRGDLRQLPRLKETISLPILRKDFIVDEIQVRESFLYGADAILLIVRLLSQQQLKDLMNLCEDLGMAALVEVHDRQDVEKAVECDAEIIGINNRNLETFEIDLCTTMKLAPLIPDKRIIVSESGIRDESHIQLLMRSGVHAVLVGTSIMKSDNLLDKAKELVFAGKIVNGKN